MAKFKVLVTYGHSSEEIWEIEAESRSLAAVRCEEIKEENRALVERCEKNGVFVGKRIKECTLCKVGLKDDLQVCDGMLKELEDYV